MKHVFLAHAMAVIPGWAQGCVANRSLIEVGTRIIPLPEGTNPSDPDSLGESMPRFRPANFVFPFLAHAAGTLVHAFVTAWLGATLARAGKKEPGCLNSVNQ
ncbi:MAG: hypothetical protein ACPGXX_06725 [Planctomycetaceae bacterium]